jgi:RimJ/RimL family protein N-acetyltransferase
MLVPDVQISYGQPMKAILHVPASSVGPELVFAQWADEHVDALVEIYRDPDIQRWTRVPMRDRDSAVAWVDAQRDGWVTGTRLCFAVHDGDGRLVGCVVLKRPTSAPEVGYWTAPGARGHGVATRSVDALSEWAFAMYRAERLELRHQVDNVASCRVAEKAGFGYHTTLPAEPPFPLDGHVHVRRPAGDSQQ